MDGNEIRVAEKVVLGDVVRASSLGPLLGEILTPGAGLHAKSLADSRRALTELAKAENAEGKTFEVAPDGYLPGRTGFQSCVFEADAPRELQHQPEGNAGGGAADGAGPANRNTAFGAGFDVEGIVPGSGRDQQLQVGQGLDDLAGEGGPLAHADYDSETLQGLDRLILAAEWLVEDLDVDVFGDRRPVGETHRNVLVIIQNCSPNHSPDTPCVRAPARRANLGRANRKDRGSGGGEAVLGTPCG